MYLWFVCRCRRTAGGLTHWKAVKPFFFYIYIYIFANKECFLFLFSHFSSVPCVATRGRHSTETGVEKTSTKYNLYSVYTVHTTTRLSVSVPAFQLLSPTKVFRQDGYKRRRRRRKEEKPSIQQLACSYWSRRKTEVAFTYTSSYSEHGEP